MIHTYKFTPQSDEEIRKEMLVEEGEQELTVAEAKMTTNGVAPSIQLNMYKQSNGSRQYVRDFLSFDGRTKFKFKNACVAAGLEKEYRAGEVDPKQFVGKNIKAIIYHKHDNVYGLQAKVKDYNPDNSGIKLEDYKTPPF